MPKVLFEKKHNLYPIAGSGEDRSGKKFLSGKSKISLVAVAAFVFAVLILGGMVYLFQVNDLATKGFEVREIETRIDDLQEERKNLKLKETELKSMYNLEKEVKDLNLVNCSNISYIEKDGPLAMK
ncbi:MAG: hypothetical protein ACOYS2_04050 [Patescibacteria group bacterium]